MQTTNNDGNNSNKKLGMGLSVLFGSGTRDNMKFQYAASGAGSAFVVRDLDIESVFPNPAQPRKHFDADDLSGLAESIIANGVLQPILVLKNPESNQYQIIAGERRFRASKIAKKTTIPAVVLSDKTEQQLLELAIMENVQRSNLSPLEEARAYQSLLQDFGVTHEKIAESICKSRSHITNMLRLLKLPEEVLELLGQGEISVGHAKLLISSDNPVELAKNIIEENLTVRGLEKLISSTKEVISEDELLSIDAESGVDIASLEKIEKALKKQNKENHSNRKSQSIQDHEYQDYEPQEDESIAQLKADIFAHIGLNIDVDYMAGGVSLKMLVREEGDVKMILNAILIAAQVSKGV